MNSTTLVLFFFFQFMGWDHARSAVRPDLGRSDHSRPWIGIGIGWIEIGSDRPKIDRTTAGGFLLLRYLFSSSSSTTMMAAGGFFCFYRYCSSSQMNIKREE